MTTGHLGNPEPP